MRKPARVKRHFTQKANLMAHLSVDYTNIRDMRNDLWKAADVYWSPMVALGEVSLPPFQWVDEVDCRLVTVGDGWSALKSTVVGFLSTTIDNLNATGDALGIAVESYSGADKAAVTDFDAVDAHFEAVATRILSLFTF